MNHNDYEKYVPAKVRMELEARHNTLCKTDWAAVEKECVPYFMGKRVRLSSMTEGSAGQFPKDRRLFIVTNRRLEDRESGVTDITFDGGERQQHVWDASDPLVKFLGRGELSVSVELDQGDDFNPDWYSPPGDTIATVLGERKISEAEFGEAMGLDEKETTDLLNGDFAITPAVAKALALELGSTQRFWLAREARYRKDKERLSKRADEDGKKT